MHVSEQHVESESRDETKPELFYYNLWSCCLLCKVTSQVQDLKPIRIQRDCKMCFKKTNKPNSSFVSLHELCRCCDVVRMSCETYRRCMWCHLTAELLCAVQHRNTFFSINFKPDSFFRVSGLPCTGISFNQMNVHSSHNTGGTVMTWISFSACKDKSLFHLLVAGIVKSSSKPVSILHNWEWVLCKTSQNFKVYLSWISVIELESMSDT